jgi:hypothetical protein
LDTVSVPRWLRPAKDQNPKKIDKTVQEGKVAFGIAVESIGGAVPLLVGSLLKKHQL